MVALAKGKVRSFDDGRGFGFITTPDCPENVFFHVKDVTGVEAEDLENAYVQFQLSEGDRGFKATDVRPAGAAGGRTERPASKPVASRGGALPVDQFRREVTELLLGAVDDLSGLQIRELRDALTDYGFDRGFVAEDR